MMKHEFEQIAGYEVSWEDYNNIIEPMYMATNLSKEEFVKTLSKKRFAVIRKFEEKPVFISTGSKTPNGCYFMGRWKMLIGQETNIRTGKTTFTVRETTWEEQRQIGWDRWLSYDIDIWTANPRFVIKETK